MSAGVRSTGVPDGLRGRRQNVKAGRLYARRDNLQVADDKDTIVTAITQFLGDGQHARHMPKAVP